MKISKQKPNVQRRVLAGVIYLDRLCCQIAGQWTDEGLFESPWANTVAWWCVRYARKYGKAPKGNIYTIFEAWAQKRHVPEELVEGVRSFLDQLADIRKSVGSEDYMTDLAARYFNRVQLQRLTEQVQDDLAEDRVEQAISKLQRVPRIEMGTGAIVDLLRGPEVWRQAFEKDQERPLLEFPGALGDLVNGEFKRGRFVSFMAPDKTGKSWWLLDTAVRALRRRLRVAYFDVGDHTVSDVVLRLATRLTRRPRFPGTYKVPVKVDAEAEKFLYSRKEWSDYLKPKDAWMAFRKLSGDRDRFRLCCHPVDSVSALDLQSTLTDWARQGWVVDVVVIDYADILAPPPGVRDSLEQIDCTWKTLRAISQELSCLVADQATLLRSENQASPRDWNARTDSLTGGSAEGDHQGELDRQTTRRVCGNGAGGSGGMF